MAGKRRRLRATTTKTATTKKKQKLFGVSSFQYSHLHSLEEEATQILQISVKLSGFSLAQAICSYGYFCLAPNKWVPATDGVEDHGYLERPLRYGSPNLMEKAIVVRIAQRNPATILVFLKQNLSSENQEQIIMQVSRMLRLDFDLNAFHKLHPEARKRAFGRTYRSPSLFEDMVKTLTNCNVTWKRTVQMNQLLCKHVGKDGSFPTPHELAAFSPDYLKKECRVGYRAPWILELAQNVATGNLDLHWYESKERVQSEIFEELVKLKGFAKFASSNVLQLLGYHQSFPFDTETVRLLKEKFKIRGSTKEQVFAKAEKYYDQYAPYQFLAYWFDLWRNYEERVGKVSAFWEPTHYESF